MVQVYTGGFQAGLPHGRATLEIPGSWRSQLVERVELNDTDLHAGMRASLWRGKCTVRERSHGQTEPATKDNSTMGR